MKKTLLTILFFLIGSSQAYAATFGDTNIETTTSNTTAITCILYTSGSAGTVNDIQVYLKDVNAPANKVTTAIFAQSGAAPGARLAVSSELTLTADNVARWYVTTISLAVTAATNYYLCAWTDNDDATRFYTTGTANQWREQTGTYNSYPTPFGTPSFSLARQMSIYADYTPSGGGTPPTSLKFVASVAFQFLTAFIFY